MKNVILIIVFLSSTSTLMNANSIVEVDFEQFNFGPDCTADAIAYGDRFSEEKSYYYTNKYFNEKCNDDGTYKIKRKPVIIIDYD
tara:strand:+ start:63 stop:317 length:255 start_codon:yes stop_codon:yes gene_type:complete